MNEVKFTAAFWPSKRTTKGHRRNDRVSCDYMQSDWMVWGPVQVRRHCKSINALR